MKKRGVKRLTKLSIGEVSICDQGAGQGTRVVLMKRHRAAGFGTAGEMVDADGVPLWRRKMGKRAAKKAAGFEPANAGDLAAALAEIESNKAFMAACAATITKTEDHPMPTTETDIQKMAIDDRLALIMKRDTITRDSAVLKMAQSRDPADIAAWRVYKSAAVAPPSAAPAPPAPVVSDAYAKMMKKAGKIAKREGISEASAFAKVFAANPDLANADRAFNFNKAAGFGAQPVNPKETRSTR